MLLHYSYYTTIIDLWHVYYIDYIITFNLLIKQMVYSSMLPSRGINVILRRSNSSSTSSGGIPVTRMAYTPGLKRSTYYIHIHIHIHIDAYS
jgi:hypothetical protein